MRTTLDCDREVEPMTMTKNECLLEGLEKREARLVVDFISNKDVGDKTSEAIVKNALTMAERPTAHKITLLSETIQADLRPQQADDDGASLEGNWLWLFLRMMIRGR